MRGPVLPALAVSTILTSCQLPPSGAPPRSEEDGEYKPFQAGISLPQFDGLGLTKVGEPGAEEPEAKNWLTVVRVDVLARGTPTWAVVEKVSRWRGVALPHDETGHGPICDAPQYLNVRVAQGGEISVGRLACEDLAHLKRVLGDLASRDLDFKVVLDFDRKAAFGRVLPVLATVLEIADRPSLRGHDPEAERHPVGNLLLVFKALAERSEKHADGQPMVCARIRADEAAPYGAVEDVILAAMRAYIWRLSFCGLLDGREVEIGSVWRSPEEPEFDVFAWHPGSEDIDEDAEEDVELEEHAGRMPGRGRGDTTVDVPPGGTGVIGNLGVGGGVSGPYGYRGNVAVRRWAALRNGGSEKSERAVEAALQWLVRHQEPDGHWDAANFGGGGGYDAGVTGLALLAFLGAGRTEKNSKPLVRGLTWVVSRQDESGCIAKGSPKPGYHHAICGLALAESYGAQGLERTRTAAQKAVDYSVRVHQRKCGGWRYMPGQEGDTSVTGWFVMQLKSAVVAGLRVDPRGFQGAIAYLDRVTELPAPGVQFPGRGKYTVGPDEGYTPPMTAIVMVCRQWMGWAREDPVLVGGANYLCQSLPKWPEADPGMKSNKLDFYYWHLGSLAMFQMGGDWWKQWNAAMRDMLVEKQHTDLQEPDLYGSWDPVGYSGAEGGRVLSTAMGSMCLETYYRYLRLHN